MSICAKMKPEEEPEEFRAKPGFGADATRIR